MEFSWSERHLAYRAEVKQAIAELLPDDWEEKYMPESYASDLQVEFSREFCPRLAERGLLTSHWPREYGGADSEVWEQFILAEEIKAVGEPRGSQYMNVNWIGPTLMRYGSDAQKEQHIKGMAGGTVVWCQGFSEPDAGTDLAALKTRAENRGDHYLINGSKIWTSYARRADWCFLLARTGSDRKEISAFLVPMDSDGISVSSFPGLPKFGHLNEVFFTDVTVPVENRVGEEGAAWQIITYALSLERLGVPRYHTGLDALDRAVAQLQAEGRFDDPIVRSRAGTIVSKFEAARVLTYLAVDQRARKLPQSMDANIARISALEAVNDLMNFLMEFVPDCIAGGDHLLEDYYRINVPANITAGTYELQLNLIARNALGLPKE